MRIDSSHTLVPTVPLALTRPPTPPYTQEQVAWYEYIRPPCVQLTFAGPTSYWTKRSFQGKQSYQCANPKEPVAAGLCCNVASRYCQSRGYKTEFQ